MHGDELDERAERAIVFDAGERGVDDADALLDLVPAALEVSLKRRHAVDRLLVEQILEARLEARQIVVGERLQPALVFRQRRSARVHFHGVRRIHGLVALHLFYDALAQPSCGLVVRVDLRLHGAAHRLLLGIQ
jgi:hypothetical protein